jgi:hypothetical protein
VITSPSEQGHRPWKKSLALTADPQPFRYGPVRLAKQAVGAGPDHSSVRQQTRGAHVPLLDLFWTMLMLFLWIAWFWVVISVVMDIFRNRETNGFQKALWVLFVIVLPWLGVLVYLIAQGDKMAERSMDVARRNQEAAQAYIRDAAGSTSTADELEKLARLKDSGVISETEFATQKSKLLA